MNQPNFRPDHPEDERLRNASISKRIEDHLRASRDPTTPSWTPEKRDSAEAAAETEAVQLELNLIYATDTQSR